MPCLTDGDLCDHVSDIGFTNIRNAQIAVKNNDKQQQIDSLKNKLAAVESDIAQLK